LNISIIGAGNLGRAVAAAAKAAGHEVTITASNPQHAETSAQALGVNWAPSNREAIETSDIVVLAVPYPAVEALIGDIGDDLAGRILVDATNRVDPDDLAASLDGTSAAEQISDRLPETRVVKAFNTVFASNQTSPVVDGVQLDGFVAGDDADAKGQVLRLLESMGLKPVDTGPLPMARVLEAMGLLNIVLNMREGWSWQTGWKLVGPTGEVP
jgi:8-hydroxy-5-deazaflavin:NADPH oxidoreductase